MQKNSQAKETKSGENNEGNQISFNQGDKSKDMK